ncbi:MAG: hypothetical protein AB7E09_08355 [Candidatus Izemoplasmatales bacterium]
MAKTYYSILDYTKWNKIDSDFIINLNKRLNSKFFDINKITNTIILDKIYGFYQPYSDFSNIIASIASHVWSYQETYGDERQKVLVFDNCCCAFAYILAHNLDLFPLSNIYFVFLETPRVFTIIGRSDKNVY